MEQFLWLEKFLSWLAFDRLRYAYDICDHLPTESDFETIVIDWEMQGAYWLRCFSCHPRRFIAPHP